MRTNDLKERVAVFNRIRDIPYAITPGLTGPDDAEQILMTNKAFCYQKHFLLGKIFSEMNLTVLYEVSLFDWMELGHLFPENIRKLAEKMPHDFHLSCLVEINGRFVLVDATFDGPLTKLGFNINQWDGENSTLRPTTPLAAPTIYHPTESFLPKNKPRVPDPQLNFYRELNAWLETARIN